MSRHTSVVILLIALCVAVTPLFAADPTADLLGSKHVSNYIRLAVDKQVIVGTADSIDDKTLHSVDGQTFAANGEISVLIASFNPLTQVWTVEGTTSIDPNYQAIKLFLDDLKPLQDTFKPENKVGGGGTADIAAKSLDSQCTALKTLIDTANAALSTPGLTAENLTNYVQEASGLPGITSAKRDFNRAITTIASNNKLANDALNSIRADFGSHNGKAPTKVCSTVGSDLLIDYVQLTGKADRIIGDKEALSRSIAELIKTSLDPYVDPQRATWRSGTGAGMTDLVFKTFTPTSENQITVNVTVKAKSIDLTDNSLTVKTADAGATSKFMVRLDSFLVPERAAAVIYNRLTYPTYGTKKESDGTTTVRRTDDTQPVSGAIMLNFIPRFGRSSVVYPMLQIGVSSAKDFPGFLAGLGFRFIKPVAFSISAGGMITRYKDLDRTLHVGDVVSGTDDINKHLQYRTSPVVPYAAIQVKF